MGTPPQVAHVASVIPATRSEGCATRSDRQSDTNTHAPPPQRRSSCRALLAGVRIATMGDGQGPRGCGTAPTHRQWVNMDCCGLVCAGFSWAIVIYCSLVISVSASDAAGMAVTACIDVHVARHAHRRWPPLPRRCVPVHAAATPCWALLVARAWTQSQEELVRVRSMGRTTC